MREVKIPVELSSMQQTKKIMTELLTKGGILGQETKPIKYEFFMTHMAKS